MKELRTIKQADDLINAQEKKIAVQKRMLEDLRKENEQFRTANYGMGALMRETRDLSTCVIKARAQGRAETLDEIISALKNCTGCVTCSRPLTSAHFCDRCKERISVEADYDGLIEWLEWFKSEMKRKGAV